MTTASSGTTWTVPSSLMFTMWQRTVCPSGRSTRMRRPAANRVLARPRRPGCACKVARSRAHRPCHKRATPPGSSRSHTDTTDPPSPAENPDQALCSTFARRGLRVRFPSSPQHVYQWKHWLIGGSGPRFPGGCDTNRGGGRYHRGHQPPRPAAPWVSVRRTLGAPHRQPRVERLPCCARRRGRSAGARSWRADGG